MKKVLYLARVSLLEIIRDRIFIALFIIGIGLMVLSIVLSKASIGEQDRILAHFGMTAMHLTMLGMCLLSGSYALARETDRQTYTTLLARPLSRTKFLLGKYLALAFAMVISVSVLCLVLKVLLYSNPFFKGLLIAATGVIFEGFVLLAVAFFASTFQRPSTALFLSFGVFLVGQWLPDLKFFATKSDSVAFANFADAAQIIFPHLYALNWRQVGLLESPLGLSDLLWPCAHSVIWASLLFIGASFIFGRKNLV